MLNILAFVAFGAVALAPVWVWIWNKLEGPIHMPPPSPLKAADLQRQVRRYREAVGEADYRDTSNETLLRLTNHERKELELPLFELDPALMQSAQAKADDMVKRGYYGHQDPDGNYLLGPAKSECLCEAPPVNAVIIGKWMRSTRGHREIFLHPDLTKVGFGFADHGRYVYAVAHFV